MTLLLLQCKSREGVTESVADKCVRCTRVCVCVLKNCGHDSAFLSLFALLLPLHFDIHDNSVGVRGGGGKRSVLVFTRSPSAIDNGYNDLFSLFLFVGFSFTLLHLFEWFVLWLVGLVDIERVVRLRMW